MALLEDLLVFLRQRIEVEIEVIEIPLDARGFTHRADFHASVSLHGRPRYGESPRIFDGYSHVDPRFGVYELVSLNHMELVGVRRPVIVDERLCGESDRVDNKRVAVLVMADRFPEP